MTDHVSFSGRLTYQPALDGLRAISVLAVLVFHSGLGWLPGGFLGVSAFFTLSGFLIGSLLLRELDAAGRIEFGRFWTRRFRRIIPAALLGIGLASFVTLKSGHPDALARLRGDGLASLFYVSNWYFWWSDQPYAQLFSQPSAFQHLWSLSIEEQFYLGLPLFLAALGSTRARSGRVVWIAAALAGSVAMGVLGRCQGWELSRLYYGTDTRAAELMMGVILAWWLGRGVPGSTFREPKSGAIAQATGLLGLAMIASCWVVVDESSSWLYSGGLLVHALAAAALIRACVAPGLLSRCFSHPVLVWLGRISYGVYVYHWPIFLWVDLGEGDLGRAVELPLASGLTVAVAWLSYHFIEEPVRRRSRWEGRRGAFLATATIASSALLLVMVRPGEPETFSQYASTSGLLRAGRDSREATRVLLIGDSLATSLFIGFERWVANRDDIYVVADAGQCALALMHERRGPTGWYPLDDACRSWVAGFEPVAREVDPDVVLVVTGFWDLQDARLLRGGRFRSPRDPYFDRWLVGELAARVDALSASGAPVLWLTAPCPGTDLLTRTLRRFPAMQPDRIDYFNRVLLSRLQERRPSRLRIVDLDSHVCPSGRFSNTIDGVEGARPDGFHFSPDAAEKLAPWLVQEFRSLPDGLPPARAALGGAGTSP